MCITASPSMSRKNVIFQKATLKGDFDHISIRISVLKQLKLGELKTIKFEKINQKELDESIKTILNHAKKLSNK